MAERLYEFLLTYFWPCSLVLFPLDCEDKSGQYTTKLFEEVYCLHSCFSTAPLNRQISSCLWVLCCVYISSLGDAKLSWRECFSLRPETLCLGDIITRTMVSLINPWLLICIIIISNHLFSAYCVLSTFIDFMAHPSKGP